MPQCLNKPTKQCLYFQPGATAQDLPKDREAAGASVGLWYLFPGAGTLCSISTLNALEQPIAVAIL